MPAPDVQKEIKRRKLQRTMQQVVLVREGQDVEAHVRRPDYYHAVYYATWRDPASGRWVLGQASVQEVHEAIERSLSHG